MKEQKQDKFGWHEALDRSYVALDIFSEYVEGHPAISSDKELEKAAEKVRDAMHDFYQLVGAKYSEFEDNDK